MLRNSVAARQVQGHMHMRATQQEMGHMLIEAIISSVIIAGIGGGLWRISSTALRLAAKASELNEPECETPSCHELAETIGCTCGSQSYTLVR